MLYQRWRRVAAADSRGRAVQDIACGRSWTFGELQAAVEAGPAAARRFVTAQGQSIEFIVAVLRAWRDNAVLVPLEPDQATPAVPLPPPPIVHLKTTSATTGPARRVAFTAEQLAADADNIVATMGLRPDWPNLGAISLAHSYGFSNLVLPLLLHGVPLVLVPAPLPEAIRRAAAAQSSITLPAVPALWRVWHDAGAIPSNVRLAISAGAPLPIALERAIREASGVKIHNFYGSTECGGIAYDRKPSPRRDDACAGSAMENVRLSVGENGCLEVRSQAVGAGYWPEPSAGLANGCYRTSDLASLDRGQVMLHGRLSDHLNLAGRKVAPEAIEAELKNHPFLRECLVFGVPDLEAGRFERVVAAVVAARPVEADVLRQFLLERLPAWQVPRDWWFVDSLAANARGKVSRAEWRHRFLTRPPQAAANHG